MACPTPLAPRCDPSPCPITQLASPSPRWSRCRAAPAPHRAAPRSAPRSPHLPSPPTAPGPPLLPPLAPFSHLHTPTPTPTPTHPQQVEAEFWRIVEAPDVRVESLYGQDLDSGHHGSGFPLPEWRRALLEAHLAKVGGWVGRWVCLCAWCCGGWVSCTTERGARTHLAAPPPHTPLCPPPTHARPPTHPPTRAVWHQHCQAASLRVGGGVVLCAAPLEHQQHAPIARQRAQVHGGGGLSPCVVAAAWPGTHPAPSLPLPWQPGTCQAWGMTSSLRG